MSAINAVNLNLGISGDILEYVTCDVDSRNYSITIPAEPKTIPITLLNAAFKNANAGDEGRVIVTGEGDVVVNVAKRAERPAFCGYGRLVRAASKSAKPSDGAAKIDESYMAAAAGLREGASQHGIHIDDRAVDKLAKSITDDLMNFDPIGTAEAAKGWLDIAATQETLANVLALGATWGADPQRALNKGYSLTTGRKGASVAGAEEDAMGDTEVFDNAPIPMRLINYWMMYLFQETKAFISTQEQDGFTYFWDYIVHTCFRRPGRKLIVSQGIFADNAEGERQAVAYAMTPGTSYCEAPFYFNETCYPLHMLSFNKLELRSKLAAFTDLIKPAKCDQYGNKVHSASVINEFKNITALVREGKEILPTTDISKCPAISGADFKTGYVITYASYREEDVDQIVKVYNKETGAVEDLIINHRATNITQRKATVLGTNGATIADRDGIMHESIQKLPYLSRGFMLFARSNAAVEAKDYFDFSAGVRNGAAKFPLSKVQYKIQGSPKLGVDDAEFYRTYAFTMGSAKDQSFEGKGLYLLPEATDVSKNVYLGGVYSGRLGQLNFEATFNPLAFSTADGKSLSYELFILAIATHIIQFSAGYTGVLFAG